LPKLSEVLSRVAYFAECDVDALAEVVSAARERPIRLGETVVTEGEPCEGLFVVIDGRVRVVKLSEEGRQQVMLILGPGRTFNDVPVFDHGVNPSNVEALENGSVAVIPRAAMRALMQRHPAIALAGARVLASRLRTMTLTVENLAFRDVTGRVASIIRGCAVGDQPLVEGVPHACAHITQEELAALAGSVREVVQRALKTLENAGAIRLGRARIDILDPDVLEDWAGGET
jgi:CRP/FNR family transcriptional regulator